MGYTRKMQSGFWFLLLASNILIKQGVVGFSWPTRLGTLEGAVKNITGKGTVYTFKKIPYAKAPVGNLRFRKPQPYGAWASTLNATTFGPKCLTPFETSGVSEDCLQLNIFIPHSMYAATRRSVMIWVHGGAYVGGSAVTYDASDIVLKGDVIVVTINYRLGGLGFFTTGDYVSRGNYGLWDQHLAFQWVHDNIADYGGDPYSVTIFGESAGGGSVSFQSLYPGNTGLFQRVISQSGVAASAILRATSSDNIPADIRKVFDAVNCSYSNSQDSVDCMRRLPSSALHFVTMGESLTSPGIDGEIVKGHAEDILQDKSSDIFRFFSSLDYMVGSLDADGGIALVAFALPDGLAKYNSSLTGSMTKEYLCDDLVPRMTDVFRWNPELKSTICQMYTNHTSASDQNNAIVDFFTDISFTFPGLLTADFHYLRSTTKKGTYAFQMTRQNPAQYLMLPYWTFPWMRGASHAMDEIYLFHQSSLTAFPNQTADFQFAETLIEYWTNFAKTGDPNGPGLPTWPKYDHLRQIQILDLQIESKPVASLPRQQFWLETIYANSVTMDTTLGRILGRQRFVSGAGKIFTFHKIPFAISPVGNLRFRKPQPFGAWTSTLNATAFGPSCTQVSFGPYMYPMSEDCLHLNIYAPYDVSPSSKRSVMVWVHGGGYTIGEARTYDGTSLALQGDVVVVTIQYRLGPLGFFSTGGSEALGNYALWDQNLAIKWVHDNIASYGGDPNSITIFGESAGGGSVSLQALYPGNKGIFQKVIAQSGVALTEGIVLNQNIIKAIGDGYIAYHKCRRATAVESVECLRTLDALTVAQGARFMPTIDGEFILGDPDIVLRNKSSSVYEFFSSLDYMAGALDGDGSVVLEFFVLSAMAQQANLSIGLSSDALCNGIAPYIASSFYLNNSQVAAEMCRMYRDTSSLQAQSNRILDMMSDFTFTFPLLLSADLHLGRPTSTYMYYMTRRHPIQYTLFSGWTLSWMQRASHGLDLLYLFEPDSLVFLDDVTLGRTMQLYWTNFAKTSNPNAPSLSHWPQYTGNGSPVQILDVPITTEYNFLPSRRRLWMETVPQIMSGENDSPGLIMWQTRLGELEGSVNDKIGKGTFYTFKKIPYAKPPLATLRFRKPQPYGAWSSILDATQFGPKCMSPYDTTGTSEDCLHLNIYVPHPIDRNGQRSVMILIHGGSYVVGSANEYDVSDMALHGNVIVVTLNYRLGVFGFFSTGDAVSPGNYGLWDQHLALQWVHNNIADYGGNPHSVTIFGESAGGGSVSFQSLYPGNAGLFKRVIPMSGVATSALLRAPAPSTLINEADKIFKSLNCSNANKSVALDCMRSLPSTVLQGVVLQGLKGFPVVDGDFILGNAEDVLQDPDSPVFRFFVSLDYMIGFANGDGSNVLAEYAPPEAFSKYNSSLKGEITSEFLCDYLLPMLMSDLNIDTKLKSTICDMYTNHTSVKDQNNAIVDFLSDSIFTYPALMSADFHYLRSSTDKGTYVYQITRHNDAQSYIFPYWTFSWMTRATHGTESMYLYNQTTWQVYDNANKDDMKLSNTFLSYWTNFAKTGNPNGPGLPLWPKYDQRRKFQTLDLNIETKPAYSLPRYTFWLDTLYTKFVSINTKLGRVLGEERFISGAGKIFTFRNIPFAKGPVGNLRFRKPEPFGPWTSTLNATAFGPSCTQITSGPYMFPMSEDCLHLNIYAPYDVSPSSKRSVMVWVHGGGFAVGEARTYDGTSLALQGDVIVVTIQYRLGPLGLFATGSNEALGNYGLWDQSLAFQWVHDNIESYGGNPDSVTIFGQSAGGGSVSFQSLYPGNKGLFQRVIPQSGVAAANTIASNQTLQKKTADRYIAFHNCTRSTVMESVQCLRSRDANVLVQGGLFMPALDGEFVLGDPAILLRNRSSSVYKFFSSLDYMVGAMDGDGSVSLSFFLPAALSQQVSSGFTSDVMCDSLAPFYSEMFYSNNSQVADEICRVYRKKSSVKARSNQVVDLLSDMMFTFPSLLTGDLHRGGSGSTYVYFMTRLHPLQYTLYPGWTFPWLQRAVHGMDLPYLLTPDESFVPFDSIDDFALGRSMQLYWTNFAKSSNPNGGTLPYWRPYGGNGNNIQILDVPISSVSNFLPDRRQLWMTTIPDILSGRNTRTTPRINDISASSSIYTCFYRLAIISVIISRLSNIL